MGVFRRIGMLTLGVALLTLLLGSANPAWAQADITLNWVHSGSWNDHGNANRPYECGRDGSYDRHAFVVFDLTNVQGTITDATLVLFNPGLPQPSPASVDVVFVNVATSIDRLIATPGVRPGSAHHRDIWLDLGGRKPNNQIFGAITLTPADDRSDIAITLTQAAIDDLNAHIGGPWAIGFFVPNITQNPQAAFDEAGDARNRVRRHDRRQLILTVQ
jgi:hypothetical protein